MAFTTINKSTSNFNNVLWTGDGAGSKAITGVGFQPDLTWVKRREQKDHHLYDAVRGTTKQIAANTSEGETTKSTGLTAFGSDGFTVGSDSGVNASGGTYVAWNWKAGTTSGITQGGASITPSGYSFNATAKQSIIKFTGTGSVATVPHGLGVKPDCILVKNLDAANEYWGVYHKSIGATAYAGYLNADNAKATTSVAWNDTEPTTNVFTIGTEAKVNGSSQNMIAYCFAGVAGYSKFGKYTGNNNVNGIFIYTGFRPTMVIIKNTAQSGWYMWDNKRDTYNEMNHSLSPNQDIAEETSREIDFLSNGFKAREARGSHNDTGEFIYMAFGQSIVGTNNIPATAR